MFSWEYPPHMVGGLGQHVFDISRFLAKQDMEVHIITPRVRGAEDYLFENGVHIHRVGSPVFKEENFKSWTFAFNSEAIRKAVNLHMEGKGFNIVHAHDWLVAYAGRAIAKIFELPLITTIHATEHGRNLGLHSRMQIEINEIEKNLALEADQVICCSNYMLDEISNLFGLKEEDINIIPNGVDPSLFLSLPKNPSFAFDKNDKIIFFIGRLVPEKGVKELINAFALVNKKIPKAKLVIGGRGPQKSILDRLCLDLAINENVIFTGFIREKDRNFVYYCADVAVFPSLYEPFGIVALEAMATNTPVIVSNVGGLAEIVEDNITGLVSQAGSVEELADKICEVLSNHDLAENLALNASKTLDTVYSWDVIAKQTIDVYMNTIEKLSKKKIIISYSDDTA